MIEHGIFYIIISTILYRTILVLILCRMETTCDGLLIREFIVKNSVEISHLSSPLEPTLWTYFLSGECLFHNFDDPKL